ncbi:MAG: BlaI/MecI/CopY family transcriptional regulator [Bacteroidales bacterium]|jgi:predicted transcriptional regulator|nr:BlaI/MecI/CopY family transcriptional regulator [Bacteroidales bacterium]
MEKLTYQEEEAMLILWRLKKAFVRDILDQYPEPKPPYTTLASTVKNLERKEYVTGRKYGNIFEYTPVVSEKEYKKQFMSGFVKDYFSDSYSNLVTFFAREHRISADELKEIIRLIENQENP